MIKFLRCDQDTTYLFKYLPDILSLTVTCLDTPDTGNMSSYLTHRMHVRNLSASYFQIFTSISHIYTRGGWQGCSGHWFRHWSIPPPLFIFHLVISGQFCPVNTCLGAIYVWARTNVWVAICPCCLLSRWATCPGDICQGRELIGVYHIWWVKLCDQGSSQGVKPQGIALVR